MNFIKKGLLTFGATVAVTGVFAVSPIMEVDAAQWEARTVEQVQADIQSTDEESSYTIQWGDTLGTISTAFDVGINEVAKVNEIADLDLIITGNVLHFSADHKTVSVEDTQTKEIQTFDLSEDEVEEVAPVEPVEPVEPAVEEPAPEPVQEAPQVAEPVAETTASDSEAEAKAWIAFKESTNNYNATNGKYIGKYQLTNTYLNGDYSPENQERVADEYVNSRYGSWTAAKEFWLQNGWY